MGTACSNLQSYTKFKLPFTIMLQSQAKIKVSQTKTPLLIAEKSSTKRISSQRQKEKSQQNNGRYMTKKTH